MILFVLLAGASVWALAQIAFQERWLLLAGGLLVPPLVIWVALREGSRPSPLFIIDGAIIGAALFLPLGVTFLVFIALVASQALLLQKSTRQKNSSN